jgi:3-methyladenine DNA glycosylase/8-oxoguanine DNA glycosylase
MHNCFESLLESIVYQQLTGKAAATILSRVKAIYQNQFPSPQQLIATELELLRSAGLSRAKAMSILDLAEKTYTGVLPQFADLEKMPDEEIIEKLSSVRGVGEWTVQMMLIFKLGRPDVMPIKDYGVRKGFARAFALAELPSPSQLLHHAEKWRPYRTVASWYLWRVPTN